MMLEYDKWLPATLQDMSIKITNENAKRLVKQQLEAITTSFKKMAGKVCMQCSGWGHIKDDWAKRGHVTSKKYCHTTKYNDIVFSTYISDKATYKETM